MSSPPRTMRLESDEVHVWRARLDLAAFRIRSLESILSPDERGRAQRFRFRKDREHFIAARGRLRMVLGRYLGSDPEELRFRYGPHGKPELDGGAELRRLRFNVSHSDGVALYAITRDRQVGVDLEWMRPRLADEELARLAERFFAPREVAALFALPPQLRREAFFACWTRKEAYIKATGKGVALGLDRFDVSLDPGEPAALLRSHDGSREVSRWSLRELDAGAGYAAALAVEGHEWELGYGQWAEWRAGILNRNHRSELEAR